MTVVTSPQGRQRIVVYETKVIWFFTNYQFFEHFGLLHKTTKCGEWSLFSCAVTYACEAPDILKSIIATHAKLFIIFFLLSFFFSKPSARIADVGKLLWVQTSYIVFV